jgi:hypothetical protein
MIALPKWVGALVLAAVVIVAPTRAAAQETTPVAANEPLRVFLDCRQPGCDGNFFIDEMPYVRFTRDRMDAEAYLLVTGLGTGAGGIQYTVNVTGQGPFVGRSDTLVSSVPPNSTADQRRRELLRIFRLGLVRYLTATSFASRLSLTYVAPTTGEPSPTAVTNDPWDAWIYRVSANGNFGGESQSRNSRFNGSLSARRITNDWKFTAGASSSYRASRYTFTDGTNTSYTLRTYSTAFRLVRSLIYSLGVQHYRYVEQTIYFLDQETRPSHQVVLAATTRQQWGSFDVQARMSQYLHDGSKQNMSVSGSTDLRLSRGFSLNLSAYASQVRDQLYLAAGTLSRDEVLTQQRALQTSYQYNFFLGLSYTFGSIYNSVVNPRLDYSGGIFF